MYLIQLLLEQYNHISSKSARLRLSKLKIYKVIKLEKYLNTEFLCFPIKFVKLFKVYLR